MNNKQLKIALIRFQELIVETGNKELIDLYSTLVKPIKVKANKNRKAEYEKYLKSSTWRKKREQLFALRGKRCESCSSENLLQIHHLTYERIFNESLDDLKILCKGCHSNAHGHG